MPTFHTGDLWKEIGHAGLVLITTNADVGVKSGELVMGRGVALEAKIRYPTLPLALAHELRFHDLVGQRYGVVLTSIFDRGTQIGAFQVKLHWADRAILALIAHSVVALREHCDQFERIAMSFPGIGAGRLLPEKVEPLLRPLPEHVHIYSLPVTDNHSHAAKTQRS